MSLLLDALNRASKDKTAADAAAQPKASAEWPTINLAVLPNEPTLSSPSPPSLRPEPPDQVRADAASQFPTLGLSLEPELTDLPVDTQPAKDEHLGLAPSIEPTLDDEPLLAAGVRATTAEAAPVQLANLSMPPSIDPPPSSPPLTQFTPAVPVAAAVQAAAQAVKSASSNNSAQSSKAAQSIMRAKEATRAISTPRPRLMALGAVAGLLSVGMVSVLMGWVDPLALMGQGSSVAPPATVAASTVSEAAPVDAAPSPQQGNAALNAASGALVSNQPKVPPTALPTATKAERRDPASATAAVVTAASPIPAQAGPAPAVAPTSAPTTAIAKPTPRPRATTTAKLSELPQMRVTAPPGASRLELAYAALTQGRLADATSGYLEVLKTNPEERDALLGLAYVSHQEGRDEEARDYYKRVLRQEPGNPTARAGLLIQNLSNDAEDVSAGSRDVAEQHPGSAAAQSVLGHSLVRQGRLADAQMAFQRAHVLEPGVALHAFNLAVALDRLKSHAAARTFYERALSLSRQSGGEQASGLPHTVVQQRIDELRQATSSNPPAAK
jgi:tetratricopeptide (TPR) repeat protein